MLSVEVQSAAQRYEELAAVRVLSAVGHGKHAPGVVLPFEILVGKGPSVNGPPPGTIEFLVVSPLDHEAGNDAVELGAAVCRRQRRQESPPARPDGVAGGAAE